MRFNVFGDPVKSGSGCTSTAARGSRGEDQPRSLHLGATLSCLNLQRTSPLDCATGRKRSPRTPALPAHPPADAAGGRCSAAGGRGVAVADARARQYGDRSNTMRLCRGKGSISCVDPTSPLDCATGRKRSPRTPGLLITIHTSALFD